MKKIIEKIKANKVLIIFILFAIFSRLFLLGMKPPHHDEGINGWFSDQIKINGFYRYDPSNYHGPLHFYLIFLFQALFGRSEFILRLPTALVSLMSFYLIYLFSRFFNKKVVYIILLATILSPGMSFYNRYAIHETDFYFFALLVLFGLIGLHKEGHKKYLYCLVSGLTGFILTKETYIIHAFSFISALLFLKFIDPQKELRKQNIAKQTWSRNDLLISLAWCTGVIIFFYSGNFLYFKGLHGIYETFFQWTMTGTKDVSGHSKPLLYWAKIFFRYEHIATVGAILFFIYYKRLPFYIKYIGLYGAIDLLIYSLIRYKTPWCIISLIWPFYFVFGYLVDEGLKTKQKESIKYGTLALFLLSFILFINLNFINYTNKNEPYIYVHTFNDVYKITKPLKKLVRLDKGNYNLTGHIIRSSEWPLPWLLGDFTMIGYYKDSHYPQVFDADFLVVESGKIKFVESNLKKKYFTDDLVMRNFQDPSRVYFEYEKFKTVFENKNPGFIPTPKVPGQGLIATYYPNKDWLSKPILKEEISNLDYFWEGTNRILPPPFSSTYEGMIFVSDIPCEIILVTDDGGYVNLDNKRIITDLDYHAMREKSFIIDDKTGWRNIKIGFYDLGGGAVIKLLWKDRNGNKVIIPSSSFHI